MPSPAGPPPHEPAAATPSGSAAALVFTRPPVVVIDACVLFSNFLRELLLHLAGRGLVVVHWTPHILDETERNIVARSQELYAKDSTKKPVGRADARRISNLMNLHSPKALLPDVSPADELRFPGVDRKDRHVAAAARTARLQLGFGGTAASVDVRRGRRQLPTDPPRVGVVTKNLADFPAPALAAHDLFVASPDAFLVALYRWGGRDVLAALAAHAAGLTRPPMTEDAYLAKWMQLDLRVAATIMNAELRLVMPAARTASATAVRQALDGVVGHTPTAADLLAARQAGFAAAYDAAVHAAELAGIV